MLKNTLVDNIIAKTMSEYNRKLESRENPYFK